MDLCSDKALRSLFAPNRVIAEGDAGRILEIACLAVVADGHVAPAELAVLRAAGSYVGAVGHGEDVAALVQRAAVLPTREAQIARLRELATDLTSAAARQSAYMLSALMAMADREASDPEFEFDIDLQDALGLTVSEADALVAKIEAALAEG